MTAKASPVGQHWGKDVGCALETAVDAASGSSYATGRTEPSTVRFSAAINRHSPTPLLGHSGVGSTQILSKKSLCGVCDSLAKKLTSPVGLQTAAEHRLRVRRPLKTLRERRSATFSTPSPGSGHSIRYVERCFIGADSTGRSPPLDYGHSSMSGSSPGTTKRDLIQAYRTVRPTRLLRDFACGKDGSMTTWHST
jgi:hypothetical protein